MVSMIMRQEFAWPAKGAYLSFPVNGIGTFEHGERKKRPNRAVTPTKPVPVLFWRDTMTTTLLDRAAVEQRVAMRRSAIYSRIAAGTFPKPIPIGGPAGKPTAVRWLASEIDAWIEARISARDA